MAKTDYKTIDQYHAAFAGAGEIVERMQQIRDIVHELAPEVEETISYQIPCFKYQGYLIYYSAYTNHISLSYPFSPELLAHFKEEFKNYKVSKSAIQFPHRQDFPAALIRAIIKFRKEENEIKAHRDEMHKENPVDV